MGIIVTTGITGITGTTDSDVDVPGTTDAAGTGTGAEVMAETGTVAGAETVTEIVTETVIVMATAAGTEAETEIETETVIVTMAVVGAEIVTETATTAATISAPVDYNADRLRPDRSASHTGREAFIRMPPCLMVLMNRLQSLTTRKILVWIDFSGYGFSDEELEHIIVEDAKLWLDSGKVFGKATSQFERFNLACPRSTVEQACRQLKEAIDHCIK